ncbi:hypothetical protein DXG01_002415 [Tephrocybe rancida]|nr:hypothetical protein DXG01_002415 [Tephrocybe rancida]
MPSRPTPGPLPRGLAPSSATSWPPRESLTPKDSTTGEGGGTADVGSMSILRRVGAMSYTPSFPPPVQLTTTVPTQALDNIIVPPPHLLIPRDTGERGYADK